MYHKKALFALLIAALPLAFAQTRPVVQWQSAARFHQLLKKGIPGTMLIDDDGISFQSPKLLRRWTYGEIQTFDLSGTRELVITGYENRHWHEPGERRFWFTLSQSLPPEIAASFADKVERPVINGDPRTGTAAIAEIPAHRRERFGGSNGTLRFRDDGIDYVDADGRDGRSWRWSDIQTVANPNPWEFRVTAYREIVEFDLKQPLSRVLFDRLWDSLYAADLNLASGKDGER
jgi:hypothetical protein